MRNIVKIFVSFTMSNTAFRVTALRSPGASMKCSRAHAKPSRGYKEREEAREASIAELREGINSRDASIAQLREDTKTLGPLREGLEARDASIAQLREGIETRDADIAQLREGIETRDADIAKLRECIKARDASIEEFRQSTSWKLMAPLRLTIHLFRFGITAAKKALSELSALRKDEAE